MSKEKLAKVYHYGLYGKRDEKYKFLNEKSISTIEWNELDIREPNFFFVKKDLEEYDTFQKYINLRELYSINSMGIATGKDDDLVQFQPIEFENDLEVKPTQFYYRPFDIRFTLFDNSILQRARYKLMSNYINYQNIGLNVVRQSKQKGIEVLVSTIISNRDLITNHTYNFLLYLYPEAGEQATLDQSGEPQSRQPNLDMKLVGEIATGLGLEFRDVADDVIVGSKNREESFAPLDLLDYIYAVLHSPTYREKYKEFLKIDFPRVPYPKDKAKFWQLVDLGSQIRRLHLLETADKYITSYPNDGSNIVERKMTMNSIGYEQTGDGVGCVWINDEQYFDGVPEVAWEFYIGGYQPAQKWLKDRVGRVLNFEDINHYQKIIVALTETDRLMKEVDTVGVE